MSEESERKASLTGQSRKVHLTLKAQDQIEVKFSVKRTVPLQKLMDAYCLERSVEANSFRFLVDGQRLKGHRTADDYSFEDGDMIDVFNAQMGGTQQPSRSYSPIS